VSLEIATTIAMHYMQKFLLNSLQACKQSMDEKLISTSHNYPKPDRHDIHTDIGEHEYLTTNAT